jgi:hypothetical protein
VRMSYYARATLMGHLHMISRYGWNVLDSIPKSSRIALRAKLKKLGIEPDVDIKPEL